MKKVSLVLEGGGMRGAYTAGALAWLLDQNIEVDVTIGISSGAMYAAMYATQDRKMLERSSIELAADSRNVGVKPIFREGTPVGYNFLFNEILYNSGLDMEKLYNYDKELLVGVYDIKGCETLWKDQHDIANEPLYLKAACTLPLAGRAVKINGRKYMDGGITTMIPIQKAIDLGCTKHIIVTTKDPDFVRKPNSGFLQFLLDVVYLRSPQLKKDFRNRTEVYYQEKTLVNQLAGNHQAITLFPTVKTNVKRFGGSSEEFKLLFNNAYQDCENKKEVIFDFLKD